MQMRQQEWLDKLETEFMDFDEHIKQLVLSPTMLDETYQPGVTHLKEMTSS